MKPGDQIDTKSHPAKCYRQQIIDLSSNFLAIIFPNEGHFTSSAGHTEQSEGYKLPAQTLQWSHRSAGSSCGAAQYFYSWT